MDFGAFFGYLHSIGFSYVAIFFLVFGVVFAILDHMRFFREKNVNVAISVAIGLLVTGGFSYVSFLRSVIVTGALLLVLLLVLLIVFKIVNVEVNKRLWGVILLVFFFVFFGLWLLPLEWMWGQVKEYVAGVFMLLVIAGAFYMITREKKPGKGKGNDKSEGPAEKEEKKESASGKEGGRDSTSIDVDKEKKEFDELKPGEGKWRV